MRENQPLPLRNDDPVRVHETHNDFGSESSSDVHQREDESGMSAEGVRERRKIEE